MPATITSRPFTEAEKLELQRILKIPSRFRMVKMAISNALLLWAAMSLAAVIVWLIVAAVAKAAWGLSFGMNTPYAAAVVFPCTAACAVFSMISTGRWIKGLNASRPAIRADLAAGTVNEEHYEFTEVKRLQEPEHGGLIYFLKSSTGSAYVFFDHESQQLGAGEGDPLKSSYIPRAQLRVVRAPRSRIVFQSEFDGPALALPTPTDLLAPPSAWPAHEEYYLVPWDEIEARFGETPR